MKFCYRVAETLSRKQTLAHSALSARWAARKYSVSLIYRKLHIMLKFMIKTNSRRASSKCLLIGSPTLWHVCFNRGIKHGFPCINICQVPREMLKTEAEGRGFQLLPRDLANVNALFGLGFQHLHRDLANVNALENNVWSLLLHKFNHNAEKK